jgi:anti-sigma-K factor RskA
MTTTHPADFPVPDDMPDAIQAQAAGYVLGDLDPVERQQFEQKLRQDSDLQAIVGSLQDSFGRLAQTGPLQSAPAGLGDRILATFEQSQALDSACSAPQTRQANRPRLNVIQAAVVAAGLATIGWLGLDNWQLRTALVTAEKNLQVANQSSNQSSSVAGLLQRPTSKLVALKSVPNVTDPAAGTMLFTPGKWQQVVLSLDNLPPLPPDQIYRMWLQLADGQVLPCGEFVPNSSGGIFVTLRPSKLPPKGVKATGVLVTIEMSTPGNVPLKPTGTTLLTGSI